MIYKTQNDINNSWKQFMHPMDPKRERRHHYCTKCGKENIRVKMEYIGNTREQQKLTVYDVENYRCPRCGNIDKKYSRIEGKGTLGHNSGKRFGTI